MRNPVFSLTLLCACGLCLFYCRNAALPLPSPAKENGFTVLFYNVENLFDTIDDPRTRDNEFLPDSKKQWTSQRYQQKLANLEKVIAASTGTKKLPAVIGLCEIENRNVVADLLNQPSLSGAKYALIHQDSPDLRGIDVALAYNPAFFRKAEVAFLPVNFLDNSSKKTRDILRATLIAATGDTFHFFVNHWPSRNGGQENSEPFRMRAAEILRQSVDSLYSRFSNPAVIIMGDFNDEPFDKSLLETLQAKNTCSTANKGELVNLSYSLREEKQLGTYYYRTGWNMLDQFIVSCSLTNPNGKWTTSTGDFRIVKETFMLYHDKKNDLYKPNRSYSGDKYLGGYSDHLPILLRIQNRKGLNPEFK